MTPAEILGRARVFPLAANGRFLAGLKWREASARGAASFPGHEGPWGVDCGKSGLFVLDVDKKRGVDGDTALALYPGLPRTYTVRTKSGGRHHYFKGRGPTTAGQLGDGLDTRGDGGMVRFYDEVVDDSPIAPIPDWLAEWISDRVRHHAPPAAEYPIEPDLPGNTASYVSWLENRAPMAVEGEGGDHVTFGVAARGRDHGLTPEKTLELMLLHWNERCSPPWEPDELERKVRNAHEYPQSAFGCRAPEYSGEVAEEVFFEVPALNPTPEDEERMAAATGTNGKDKDSGDAGKDAGKDNGDEWDLFGEPVRASQKTEENKPFKFSSLSPTSSPPRQWLIRDWIPLNCVASIYGPPGSGKSYITLELGMSIANGVPWFGQKVDHPAPTLFVSCEDNKDELHFRGNGIRRKAEHQPFSGEEGEFYCWDRVGRDSLLAAMTQAGPRRQKFMDLLEEQVAALAPEGERRVLILDTLSDIGAFNENDRGHVNYFLKFVLGGFATRHNATVIYLAHPSKSSAYSGSTAMPGAVRAQIFLDFVEDQPTMRRLRRGKTNRQQRDGEEDGLMLKFGDGAFHLVDGEAFATEARAERKRAVWNAIKQAMDNDYCLWLSGNSNNPIKALPIRTESGARVAPDDIKGIVNELINDGTVESVAGKGLIAVSGPTEVWEN